MLLYYCLTGELPYEAGSTTQLLGSRRRRPPAPARGARSAGRGGRAVPALLDADPCARPTSPMAALLLAEAVDARVYVPMTAALPRQREPQVSPWTSQAAAEATEAMVVDAATSGRVG
ncbi:hypothetical protein V2I01_40335 [Micromonospora sp. BRA006-A]|nr:hypothetical protein [Micromonospora sp. BRA006-A]